MTHHHANLTHLLQISGQRMMKTLVLSIFFATFVFATLLAQVASAGEDVVIRLETSPATGALGDLFTTTIYADNIDSPGLGSWQANITYDTARLEIDQITWGTDLFSTGRTKLFETAKTNTPGQVLLTQVTLAGPDGPTGANLHLATIVWRAVGSGTAHLDLSPPRLQKLRDINNDPITPVTLVGSQMSVDYAFWLPLIRVGDDR
jgi:hypothetical protein